MTEHLKASEESIPEVPKRRRANRLRYEGARDLAGPEKETDEKARSDLDIAPVVVPLTVDHFKTHSPPHPQC